MPWEHIDVGVSKDYLWAEREKSLAGENPPPTAARAAAWTAGCATTSSSSPACAAEADPARRRLPLLPLGEGERLDWRFRLEKTGPARYLGHLEMMRLIERTIRAAGVELAYTQGFHPHALVKTAAALTTWGGKPGGDPGGVHHPLLRPGPAWPSR